MGNGQNRRRRGGAHTRNGPHRSGPPVNDRRGATHVMPPTPADDASAGASDDGEETLVSGMPDEASAGEEQDTTSEAEPRQPEPVTPHSEASEPGEAAPPAPEAVATPEIVAEPEAPEPEQRAPRGRFERFYAPGQQKRPASNGQHSAPERPNTMNGGGENGSSGNGHHVTPAHAPHALDDDDEEETQIASGPRADVRGPVGDLIDVLHDLFVRDRAVASQGGISRCGICYLHYPLGELVYHDSEGFYVCQTCERALGGARVNMVRRQQRQ